MKISNKKQAINKKKEMNIPSVRSSSRLNSKKLLMKKHAISKGWLSGQIGHQQFHTNTKCYEKGCCQLVTDNMKGNKRGGMKQLMKKQNSKEGVGKQRKKKQIDRDEGEAGTSQASYEAISGNTHRRLDNGDLALTLVPMHLEENTDDLEHDLLAFVTHLIEVDHNCEQVLDVIHLNFSTFPTEHPRLYLKLLLLNYIEICAEIQSEEGEVDREEKEVTSGKLRKAVELGKEATELCATIEQQQEGEGDELAEQLKVTLSLLFSNNAGLWKVHPPMEDRHQMAENICELLKPLVTGW